jgi:hypothetical protein
MFTNPLPKKCYLASCPQLGRSSIVDHFVFYILYLGSTVHGLGAGTGTVFLARFLLYCAVATYCSFKLKIVDNDRFIG